MQSNQSFQKGRKNSTTLISIIVLLLLVILYLLFFRKPPISNINTKVSIEKFNNSYTKIGLSETQELYDNYNKRLKPALDSIQNTVIQRDGKYNVTEYVWVSMDELNDYVNFLKAVSEINKEKVSGLAIYFGAYGLNKNLNNDKTRDLERLGDYRGRLTTFFVPTYYDDTTEVEYDIFKHKPFYIDSKEGNYKGDYKALNLGKGYQKDSQMQSKFIMSLLPIRAAEYANANEFHSIPPK